MARPKKALHDPYDYQGCRIYPPADGSNRWRISVTDRSGRRAHRRATNQAEAEAVAAELTSFTEGGHRIELANRPVADLISAYGTHLDQRVALHEAGMFGEGVTEDYAKQRKSRLRIYALPVLGDLRVMDWTDKKQSRAVLYRGAQAGLGPLSIQTLGSSLRSLVTFAHDDGWMSLAQDPMRGVRYSAKSTRQDHSVHFVERAALPTGDDVDRLTKGFVATGHPRLATAVALMRCSALRYGELRALRPCDIDLDERSINVDWQLTKSRHQRRLPKWNKTRRTFFVNSLLDELTALVETVELLDGPEALLFPGPHGGPMTQEWFRHRWIRAAQAAGWPMDHAPKVRQWPCARWSPHDLRHYAACWMLHNAKMDPADVSSFLGHTSVAFTLAQYVGLRGNPNPRAKSLTEDL